VTHPSEVDAVTHEFSQIAVKALHAARQIMVARQHQTQLAHQAAQNAAAQAHRAAQQADLARHWRAEALAARWAAAEAMRERDPQTADAWSERLADSGVDTSTLSDAGALARVECDVTEAAAAEASVVVAEHLAGEYVNEALDAPSEAPAPSPPEGADVTALIADTRVGDAEKSSQPDLTPDQPAASVDTGPVRDTGVTL